jgi:outer membrane protein assembly factor BamA
VAGAQEFQGQTVTGIVFQGLDAVRESELREVITTQQQRCRSILYRPICWVSDSRRFQQNPGLDALELERDRLRIRVHYFRAGYRTTQADVQVIPGDGGVQVVFVIEEGPPTLVEAIDVLQEPAVLSPRQLRAVGLPPAGGPLDLTAVATARARIQSLLLDQGYADATVGDTIFLSDSIQAGRIRLDIIPGPVTTLGELYIQGNEEVSDRTIRRLVGLEAGAVFRRQDLEEAQRRLYRSELFRQAIIQVRPSPDSIKPLSLLVREAPFRDVRLGVGLTTLDFVQMEARATLHNWMGAARRAEVRGTVGNLLAPELFGRTFFGNAAPFGVGTEVDDVFLRPTWQVGFEVSQPWLFSPRNSVSAGVFAHRRSVPAIVVDQGYGATLTFTRRIFQRTPASLTYRYEINRVEANDLYFCVNFGICQEQTITALSGRHSLSPLRLLVRTDRSDDPLEPRAGWIGRIEAEHASIVTASDFRYNRLTLEAIHYLSIGSGVLATRLRGGWVRGSAGTGAAVGIPEATGLLLHPRTRFYAGGSRSVRGYGEGQLGPRILTVDPALLLAVDSVEVGGVGEPCTPVELGSGTCDPEVLESSDFTPRPLGGTSVLEGSLEYRLPLSASLWAALFVDAASVGDAGLDVPSGIRRAITPGVGVRYASPVGPIRVDLGVRPTHVEMLPVVTQVESDGEGLRLIQLEAPMRYDPTQGGGFFRRLASRLQLHLSIGEAF